ncbi:MAG: response regulator [Lewinellaceae bacterium]|nr:response regulator [Phaeodactylibacter sp.]MCB9039901.1 response regulator [Lewinellaceae bacterium]
MPKKMLLLAFLAPVAVFAQQSSGATSLVAETPNYRIEEFRLPGGQPGNNVTSIVQGPNGFLWFGSHKGLHRYDGHSFITYEEPEGDTLDNSYNLAFSYVENLYWDLFGKLWVCTYGGGLFCFDPQTEQFKRYQHDPEAPHSISQDRVMCAAEDAGGNLWFGTELKGVNRFDRKTERFERYLPDPANPGSLSHRTVKNIYLDRQGTLWVATGAVPWGPYQGGLNRYDPGTDSFIRYTFDYKDSTSLWTNAVQGLLEDSRGNFWVTTTAGLQKMNRKTGTFERMHYHPNKPHAPGAAERAATGAFSLLEDKNGGLWVGTVGIKDTVSHLLRYDPETATVENLPLPIDAWRLVESGDGAIWVAGGKVMRITPRDQPHKLRSGTFIFDAFQKASLYRELSINRIEDHWFGPSSMAINAKDGTLWTKNIYGVRTRQHTSFYPILANYNQDTGETRFYHLSNLQLTYPNSGDNSEYPNLHLYEFGLAVGQDEKIWGTFFSEHHGIFCFDPRSGNIQNYRHNPQDTNSLTTNLVEVMMMDSRGEIWAGHFQNGLSRFNPVTGQWTRYRTDAGAQGKIGGYSPDALAEGPDGKIWVGGATIAGQPFITAIDPVANTSQNYKIPETVAMTVRFIAAKEDKIIFALDQYGLGVLFPGQPGQPIHFYNLNENNFPINNAASMVFGRQGLLWVSSIDDGNFACLNVDRQTWFSFRNDTGWPTLPGRGLLGLDGHILFTNPTEGWTEIDPKAYSPLLDSSKTCLVDLYIKEERQIPGKSPFLPQPIWALGRLDIPQRDMPVSFRFSSFHFRSPRVVYHYRLYPFETNWKTVEENPIASYSYIPVGAYQFQVKAFTMNGLLDEKGIDLTVAIHPPWWKTWWAYSIFAIVFLALLTGLFLYQRRRYQLQARLQIEQESAKRLKELDHFKSRFYTNITHEFRTPLTVIKGMAGQIEGQEKIKTLIERNSNRLLAMVNQLLDLSRLENNSLAINWVQGNVIPYLQYLTESCHSLANDKRINLAFFSKEDSLVMDYDEAKLQNILVNLLSNAIKFTPEYGSVKVTAAQVPDNGSPFLELAVSDTGKGIEQDKLPHIFDRFYQADNSATRQGEGSGIGLALVKELVQLLEGSIEVKSEVGKGTKFVVMLPIRNEAETIDTMDTRSADAIADAIDPIAEPAIASIASIASTASPPLVLIIEDNADVTEYIISCLSEGYALETARNGKEGVEKALKIVPDVILSDVMMPEMDGFEVCRILKSSRATSHIPIVLLTAKATQEDKVAGLSQGADAYLTKPFDKEELLVRLRNLAAVSKRLRERLSDATATEEEASEQEQQEAAFLRELVEVIETNLGNENFDTNRLCRAVALGRTQLHNKLKALTGTPTAAFIRSVRLKKAKSLLESTDLMIGDIAVQVGYKDFSHFSRSFGKEFGVLPSEVRK